LEQIVAVEEDAVCDADHKREHRGLVMDEGRKRVIGIMAAIPGGIG
jgi:hypothetical protein